MEHIADLEFTDRVTRPVYREDGRYFVIDDDGQRIYGDWILDEPEPHDTPTIIGSDVPKFE